MGQGHALFFKQPAVGQDDFSIIAESREVNFSGQPAGLFGRGREASFRAFLQSLINRLTAPAALIATDGTIAVTNLAWDRFADREAKATPALGENYLDHVHDLADRGSADHVAISSLLDEFAAGRKSPSHLALKSDSVPGARVCAINLTSMLLRDEKFILVHLYE